jgi:hypothetical protein
MASASKPCAGEALHVGLASAVGSSEGLGSTGVPEFDDRYSEGFVAWHLPLR